MSLPALFPKSSFQSMDATRKETNQKRGGRISSRRTRLSFRIDTLVSWIRPRGWNEKRDGGGGERKEENRLWYARCIRDLHSCRRVHLDGDVAIRWHKDWLQGYRELCWQERRFSLLHPPPPSPSLPLSRLNPPRRSPSLSTAHSRYLFAFSNAHRWQRPRNPPPLEQLIDLSNGVQLIHDPSRPPDLSLFLRCFSFRSFITLFPSTSSFFFYIFSSSSILDFSIFRFWKERGS